jgi:integrase
MGSGWTEMTSSSAESTVSRFIRRGSVRRSASVPASSASRRRHGWATLALAAGVHPKVDQERLGHASIGITLDLYSHVTAGLHDEAAVRVA